MKISVKDGKVCEKILKIEVGSDLIQKEYDEYYKAIAPKAKVPGFRPGKAPRNVLALHYGGDARESVLKHLISESYRQAVQEKTLQPLGYPEINEVEFKEEKLSYQAKIEVRPKIKLSRVTGLSAKKEKIEIKDEELNDTLQRIRESFAQFKAVEDRPAAMGDFVIADYVCTADGKEVEKRSDDWFELKEDGEFLKGFASQLVGSTPGSEKEVNVSFPEKLQRKELAGKAAVFAVKIKEVKTKVLPELNDDLAKEAGAEFKTLDELKARIRQQISESKEREVEAKYEKALLDELVKHNKLDLPEGLILRRAEKLVEDAMRQYHPQEHGEGKEKEAELRETVKKEMQPEARRQVHVAFLLDEIAAKENIQVAPEEVAAKIEEVAAQVRQPVDAVKKYYAEHEEAVEGLHDQIRNEKAIEFIKKKAKEA